MIFEIDMSLTLLNTSLHRHDFYLGQCTVLPSDFLAQGWQISCPTLRIVKDISISLTENGQAEHDLLGSPGSNGSVPLGREPGFLEMVIWPMLPMAGKLVERGRTLELSRRFV